MRLMAYRITFISIIVFFFTTCNMKQPDTNTQKQGGVVFIKTKNPEKLKVFYTQRVGCTIWLEQGGCFILQHGNLLLGFCDREEVEKEGVFTFFYLSREEVDSMYDKLKDIADGPPRDNELYKIYHFYANDPEGRTIEFQYFNHPVKEF